MAKLPDPRFSDLAEGWLTDAEVLPVRPEDAALVAAGDWTGVKSHCASDVYLTRELHRKLLSTEAA